MANELTESKILTALDRAKLSPITDGVRIPIIYE